MYNTYREYYSAFGWCIKLTVLVKQDMHRLNNFKVTSKRSVKNNLVYLFHILGLLQLVGSRLRVPTVHAVFVRPCVTRKI
jgi:hypothetical protein